VDAEAVGVLLVVVPGTERDRLGIIRSLGQALASPGVMDLCWALLRPHVHAAAPTAVGAEFGEVLGVYLAAWVQYAHDATRFNPLPLVSFTGSTAWLLNFSSQARV